MSRKRIRFGLTMLTIFCGFNISPVAQASATPFARSRWPHPRVTYVIHAPTYERQVYQTAIRAWNATGQFKLIAGSAKHHQLVLTTSRATTGTYFHLAGITFTTGPADGYYTRAKVFLLTRNLAHYGYDYWDRVHVAEHELGHVMGLKHSRDRHSVMLADNRYNGISHADILAVKQRYRLPVGKL